MAATLANAWAESGDEVELVATFSRGAGCRYPLGRGVRFMRLVDQPGIGSRSGLFARLVRLRALRGLLATARPHLAVAMLTNVNVAAILATRGLGIPVVVSERIHPGADEELGSGWRVLRCLTYPMADAVVAQTVAAAETLRMSTRARSVMVLPNPLPAELRVRVPRAKREFGNRPRLVAMGRLERQKGFDGLIGVFARLARQFLDWDLWIWGEGSQRPALEEQVARLGLKNRVFLPGWTPNPWDELERADLFVLPSRWEGFPNALLEAMALGVPCVAYDCPAGPREITRGGQDAVLVPPGDDEAMERALRALMADDACRREVGAKGAVSVRERYALPKVLAMWDEIFRSLGVARE